MTHSVHKPVGYSDLSTNSRSSLNNTIIKKRQLTPSKRSNSQNKLKHFVVESSKKKATKKIRRLNNFDLLNKQATLLIERSINKNRMQMTPKRVLNVDNRLDLSGISLSNIKNKVKPIKNLKRPLSCYKGKRKIPSGTNSTSLRSNNTIQTSLQHSMDTANSYMIGGMNTMYPSSLRHMKYPVIGPQLTMNNYMSNPQY